MPEKQTGRVAAVCRSRDKGTVKQDIGSGRLLVNFGLEGDAHGGDWHRQVSLLAVESIDKMRAQGLELDYGDFAENITTTGLNLVDLPIGTRLMVGEEAVLEITQIGKECHQGCEIFQQVGSCIMPMEGVFSRVLKEGTIKKGDIIRTVTDSG